MCPDYTASESWFNVVKYYCYPSSHTFYYKELSYLLVSLGYIFSINFLWFFFFVITLKVLNNVISNGWTRCVAFYGISTKIIFVLIYFFIISSLKLKSQISNINMRFILVDKYMLPSKYSIHWRNIIELMNILGWIVVVLPLMQ